MTPKAKFRGWIDGMSDPTLFDLPPVRGKREVARDLAAAERAVGRSVGWPVLSGEVGYEDESSLFLIGDCRELLVGVPDDYADICITDPPYSSRTHVNVRGNVGGSAVRRVAFDSFTVGELRELFGEVGRVTRRWVVATVDYRHAVHLEEEPPPGLRVLRVGIFCKTHPMPSIRGDRPGMGWEAIIFMHRVDATVTWNGGGRSGVWHSDKDFGPHPTGKPLPMLCEWVRLFSEPGDVVLDPFVGSGSTLVAAKVEGRRGLGFEVDRQWAEVAAGRLGQGVLDFG